MVDPDATARFDFAFDRRFRLLGRLFGVTPERAMVKVDADHLTARFGPWTVRTPLANIADATVTGPYAIQKTVGPAHLSLADRGLTFATNADRGVCLTFKQPVTGMDPLGLVRHPGLTVTVADPEALVEALGDRRNEPDTQSAEPEPEAEPVLTSVPEERIEELEEGREEQEAEDELHLMTASELRTLADERGIAHTSRMKKADLVELLEADIGDDLVEVIDAHDD